MLQPYINQKDIMAKSINKVILVGNVGKDPEIKFLPSGLPVANFSLATIFPSTLLTVSGGTE